MPDESSLRPTPHEPRLTIEQHGVGAERELVLVKNGQRYTFRCAAGDEPILLNRLAELVRDPKIDLDWFDAAVLSHQIGERLGQQLQQMRRP